MKKSLLLLSIIFCVLSLIEAQETWSAFEPIIEIDTLKSGQFEIRAYTLDSLPIYKGTLSSADPEAKEGKFYFLDSKGRIKAVGQYAENFPVGIWTYYDTLMRPTKLFDYDNVFRYLSEEAQDFSIDTLALQKLKSRHKTKMNEDGTFSDVEEFPKFRNELPAISFREYIYDNLHTPAFPDAINFEDTVEIGFIVDSKGNIRQPFILKSSLNELNIESMRVLIESDDWQAGEQHNIPVDVCLKMSFEFIDPDNSKIYHIVEEMPLFNGNEAQTFNSYIEEASRFPDEAAKKGISGTVIVQFVVNEDGLVEDVQVVRGIHPLLDNEAMRVIMSSPAWTPGKQRGKAVSVRFSFPVRF